MASKEFLEILETMKSIHIKKSADYSSDSNPFSNFDFSAELVKHFNEPIDVVFISLISTKLSRLSELLSSGKVPNNESIEDSFIDLANYCVLWGAYYRSHKKN